MAIRGDGTHVQPALSGWLSPPVPGGTTGVTLDVAVATDRTVGATAVSWSLGDAEHPRVVAPGLEGEVDMARAAVRLTLAATVAGEPFTSIIRGLLLLACTRLDRHPIHASAVRLGDAALVFHGPSGAGKSTLAYAATALGARVLTDDAIRVQLAPTFCLWGHPGEVHLLDDARAVFGLADGDFARVPARLGAKHVVPTAPTPPRVARARVCLLEPHRGPVRLSPAGPDEIATAIVSAPEQAADLSPAQRARAAAALASPGGWRLRLSDDVREALPAVAELLATLAGVP